MDIQVLERAQGLDGWIFLPVRQDKDSSPYPCRFPAASPLLSRQEWEAGNEAMGLIQGVPVAKAAPVELSREPGPRLQEALAKALRWMEKRDVQKVGVVLPPLPKEQEPLYDRLLEVPDLLSYESAPYKSRTEDRKAWRGQRVVFLSAGRRLTARLQQNLVERRIVCTAVNETRRLTDQPGNLLSPEQFVTEAMELKRLGVRVRPLAKKDLDRMGGLHAVAAGSPFAPTVMQLEWGPADQRPFLLVGKGVTFDTGGISLKPGEKMHEMKTDMGGGAAVLGTVRALAQLGCPRRVVGLIPLAENMPDGKAVRPGDVVRLYDGQTVEILNTDAEGRLLLADALAYGQRFDPLWTVDLATLTGGIIVALGSRVTGLFCSDDGLRDRLLAAGRASGDLLWPMPLFPHYGEEMKSPFADWKNAGGRGGGTCMAAAFLSAFTRGPWAHLDIAGTSLNEKETALWPKAATGVGVQLLVRLIQEGHRRG